MVGHHVQNAPRVLLCRFAALPRTTNLAQESVGNKLMQDAHVRMPSCASHRYLPLPKQMKTQLLLGSATLSTARDHLIRHPSPACRDSRPLIGQPRLQLQYLPRSEPRLTLKYLLLHIVPRLANVG